MQRHVQYCPVSYAAELMGDRWNLLIMREMIGGATRFNEIERCLPKISRSLLAQRLRLLTRQGLIDATPAAGGRGNQYRLTDAGAALEPILLAMGNWAIRWVVGEPRPEELDPNFLMWWLHRRVNHDALPAGRTVVRFDVVSQSRDIFWLVLEDADASLCVKDPGFEIDVHVMADSMAFHRVFAGRITLDTALKDETITVTGNPGLVRRFGSWFCWSPFYDATRALLDEHDADDADDARGRRAGRGNAGLANAGPGNAGQGNAGTPAVVEVGR
jgi:DNA-binding HxlR family transcriptional regulator